MATAPVWGVVVAGIVAGSLVNYVDSKWKVTKKLKSGVNSMIKGVSGWFK
ncbi:TPA: hypothetical protein IU259_002881 [Enterococcus faecalis]|nr:hypothetical protein [Enterococcus faecalis]